MSRAMADECAVIEGTVKFRDGKKWKSRWCVIRKLSPVADCLHIQLYRDSRSRCKRAPTEASLSLRRFVGIESGFTLDREANTIAIICQDVTALLAFDTRETLMRWRVKVSSHAGETRRYPVLLVGEGSASGPARLHVSGGRFALCSGAPPRLIAMWEIAHLRRYGVVDGKFCFEGGSRCGRGEGVHVLLTEKARDIVDTIDLAAKGSLTGHDGRPPDRAATVSHTSICEDAARRTGRRRDVGHGDALSMREDDAGVPWDGSRDLDLGRCTSCMSELGAMSRSSTAALTPSAADFSPAWTMESPNASHSPPEIPPKPTRQLIDCRFRNESRPGLSRHLCACNEAAVHENYNVPKCAQTEIHFEHYDTPKRFKQRSNDELFEMTSALISKKSRERLSKVDGKRPEESAPTPCPCERATGRCGLPCRRRSAPDRLYTAVHLARKTERPVRIDADYENLSFAVSSEHYENAEDVPRRAGVTRLESNALGAGSKHDTESSRERRLLFGGNDGRETSAPTDDYLVMEPRETRVERTAPPPAGYAPMSPVTDFHTHAHPKTPIEEKSASDPSPSFERDRDSHTTTANTRTSTIDIERSADSSRRSEDAKDSNGGVDGSSSSLETSTNVPIASALEKTNARRSARMRRSASAPWRVEPDGDSSGSDDSGVSSRSRLSGATRPSRPSRSTDPFRRTRSTPRRDPAESAIATVATEPTSVRGIREHVRIASDAIRHARCGIIDRSRRRSGASESRSASSGTSDMSDYIETLSLSSGRSSGETPTAADRRSGRDTPPPPPSSRLSSVPRRADT